MMTQNTVLLNDFKRQWESVGSSVLASVEEVGKRGWYILGEQVAQFESVLAPYFGCSYAVGVANGMDAIEIALRSLNVGVNDFVLTTPLSAFATTLAILRVGAKPVFVDTDDQGLIDLDLVKQVLNSRPEIRVFLPVHLYGRSLDLKKLRGIKDHYGLRLIEDCAQSIGARDPGGLSGSLGQATATSFYPTKNLGGVGDGGAFVTSDTKLAEKARCLRNYGQSSQYIHSELGMNSRLDELQAALLRNAILPQLSSWNVKRSQIAQQYLAEIRHPALELPRVRHAEEPVWHLFPVIVQKRGLKAERQHFQEHLKKCGISTGIHYPRLISDQKALIDYGKFEVVGDLRNAQRFASSEVSLPIHPFLTGSEIQRVIEACNGWVVE